MGLHLDLVRTNKPTNTRTGIISIVGNGRPIIMEGLAPLKYANVKPMHKIRAIYKCHGRMIIFLKSRTRESHNLQYLPPSIDSLRYSFSRSGRSHLSQYAHDNQLAIPQYTPKYPEYRHEKPVPEYPTAGAGIGVRVYSDRGKRIGPVFSSVEKAQDYLSRR